MQQHTADNVLDGFWRMERTNAAALCKLRKHTTFNTRGRPQHCWQATPSGG